MDGQVTYHTDEAAADALQGYVSNILGEAPPPEEKKPEAAPPEQPAQEEAPETAPEAPETPEAPIEDTIAAAKRRFKVKNDKGDDEEVEMTVKDMESAVMMQRDYQRKTAEMARQREKLEADMRQAVEAEQQRLTAHAHAIQQTLLSVVAPEFRAEGINIGDQMAVQSHLSRLSREDPAKAIQISNRLNEVYAALQVVNKAAEVEGAKRAQQRAQQFAKSAREAWEDLSNIKGWGDETYNRLLKTGYEYGFKPAEIANPVGADGRIPDGYLPATDPRFLRLLHDADQFRQLQRQKPAVEKRVAEAPKVLKPGGQAKSGEAERSQQAMGRLRKSGKLDDAAAAIFSRMK